MQVEGESGSNGPLLGFPWGRDWKRIWRALRSAKRIAEVPASHEAVGRVC